ncbi:MAG: hypothetical protein IPL96_04345 [Holophagaceae bacterium]|nr:hypothetical protein [Holophagaceae bacterium]
MGIEVAYYLVHSMAAGQEFRERDHAMAQSFGKAAAAAGVKRIVYLGGLGDPVTVHASTSSAGVRWAGPGGVRRAGDRVPRGGDRGPGSASFEMIRHLTGGSR